MKHEESIKIVTLSLKLQMIRSNLCDYGDAYILVSGTMTITGEEDDDAAKKSRQKK